jgi:hypothetical protein
MNHRHTFTPYARKFVYLWCILYSFLIYNKCCWIAVHYSVIFFSVLLTILHCRSLTLTTVSDWRARPGGSRHATSSSLSPWGKSKVRSNLPHHIRSCYHQPAPAVTLQPQNNRCWCDFIADDLMSSCAGGPISVVQSLLEELPGQFLQYMRTRGIKPQQQAPAPPGYASAPVYPPQQW